MKALFKITLAVAGVALATHAAAQVSFYEHPGYEGRSFTTQEQIDVRAALRAGGAPTDLPADGEALDEHLRERPLGWAR